MSDLKGKSNTNVKHSPQKIFPSSSGGHEAHVIRGAALNESLDNSEGPMAQMN